MRSAVHLYALLAAIASASSFSLVNAAFSQDTIPRTVRLATVDGPVLTTKSLSLADGKLTGAGLPSDLKINDLLTIDFEDLPEVADEQTEILVEFRGGRIFASSVAIAAEKCRLKWQGSRTLELPLDLVRHIRLRKAPIPEFDKAATIPAVDQDRLLVRGDDGSVTVVSGVLDSLTEEQVGIQVGGQARLLPRSSVIGLIIAQPALADAPQPITVQFRDGSHVTGENLAVLGADASLILPENQRISFAWSDVQRVIFRTSRVAYLAELKPAAESQRSIVAPSYPAQRGHSASGGPLQLGSQRYESGIGVHAHSEITFAAGGQWDFLAATIGLDQGRGKKGDCIFQVLADGKVLFSERCRGSDSPREIKLPIAGCQQLTLLVEPGELLDLGDHANWCDARFIKAKQ